MSLNSDIPLLTDKINLQKKLVVKEMVIDRQVKGVYWRIGLQIKLRSLNNIFSHAQNELRLAHTFDFCKHAV